MKSFLVLVTILICLLTASGQSDSVNDTVGHPEYDFLYQELFNFDPASTFGTLVPDLNFTQLGLTRWTNPFGYNLNLSQGITRITTPSYGYLVPGDPFLNSFSVLGEATCRLNDKFTLSGNSFSVRSIFDPSPLNQNLNTKGIKGASMFLQYKVSKNFHIGGGVSISNTPDPW